MFQQWLPRVRRVAAIGCAAGALAACSSVSVTDKIDYQSVKQQQQLDVPPDLAPVPTNDRFAVPGSATASTTAGVRPAASLAAAVAVAPSAANARIERAGGQRWLAVDVPPEQAYAVAKEFWPSIGLALEREDPALGILETAWAENRAKLPQDWFRRSVGKLIDGAYDTGERDKYRTRIERTAKNTAEIYISHRGMIEVYTAPESDRTRWQPRPADAELEAEMLQRLLLRFAPAPRPAPAAAAAPGKAPATVAAAPAAAAAATAAATVQTVRLVKGADGARLEIDEAFDRAWRRIGLGLDRGGFTVEDRDRANGLYFVRYLDPEVEAKQRSEQGVLSRLFGSDPKIVAPQYRVQLAAQGNGTGVTVLDKDGKPENSPVGEKMLTLLRDQLR